MAHRLLVPPVRRLEGQARLPMIQDPGRAIQRQLADSLLTRDSLRMVKTSPTNKCASPLPAIQEFAMNPLGHPNDPDQMRSGLRIGNAGRLVDKTRGQSAGI